MTEEPYGCGRTWCDCSAREPGDYCKHLPYAALARVLNAILGKKLHEREPIIGTFLYRSEQGITLGAIVPSDAYRGALTRMGLR